MLSCSFAKSPPCASVRQFSKAPEELLKSYGSVAWPLPRTSAKDLTIDALRT
jgi:hypothetical protein